MREFINEWLIGLALALLFIACFAWLSAMGQLFTHTM